MPESVETTWYGSDTADTPLILHRKHLLLVAGAVLALVALRTALPIWLPSDAMAAHERLAQALLLQQNWSKQALVGVLEYPPLPTIVILLVQWLINCLPVAGTPLPSGTAGRLVVSVCQVWMVAYAWRIAGLYLPGKSRILATAALCLLPVAGPLFAQADPYWVVAVLLASCIFHVCRWEQRGSLRDVVVLALNAGLLGLCGIAGIAMAIAMLLAVWVHGGKHVRGAGGPVLLAMPLAYVLLLYPLFNWLIIEDDPFFMIRRLLPWFSSASGGGLEALAANPLAVMLVSAVSVLAVAGLMARRLPLLVKTAWTLAAAACLVATLRLTSGLYIGGEYLLAAYAAVPALLSLVVHKPLVGPKWSLRLPMIAGSALALAALFVWRQGAKAHEAFIDPHPDPAAIIQMVDAQWQDSRILVYDLRAALIYNHANPSRFPARIDYGPDRLKFEFYVDDPALLGQEQFHFLLPPADGTFYAPGDPQMAPINLHGHPDLMFEQKWEGSGWQLWRVIRRPDLD